MRQSAASRAVVVVVVVVAGLLIASTGSGAATKSLPSIHSQKTKEPSVWLDVESAPPGGTVRVEGDDFSPKTEVEIYLVDVRNGGGITKEAEPITTSRGRLLHEVDIPLVPGGPWAAIVVREPNGGLGRARLDIAQRVKASPREVTPFDQLCATTGQGQSGATQLDVAGVGFGTSEALVKLQLNGPITRQGKSASKFQLGSIAPSSDGAIYRTVNVPQAPYGHYTLEAEGPGTFGAKLSAESDEISLGFQACDDFNDDGGTVYDSWEGVGTDADSAVEIIYNGSEVGETTAGSDGSWEATDSFYCPPGTNYPYGIVVELGGKKYTYTNPLSC
jgi:hypothetical protein